MELSYVDYRRRGGIIILYRTHRGGCFYTPENTMAAFNDALKEGFHGIETDPCYTKDEVIVLHHDYTINRTCRNIDGSKIKNTIYLEDLKYDELMEYDAGIHMGEKFCGEKIPRLDELLALAEGTGVVLYLDKKIPTDNMDPFFDVLEKYDSEVYYSCEDLERIKIILNRFPNAKIDYNGPATEEMLTEVLKLVKYENLIVWMYMDKPNFDWLADSRKASKEKCETVKKFARLGVGNVNNPYDMREALMFAPDVMEV